MTLPVFGLLAATPAVTAIIGTSPVRCYPAGTIPQNPDGTPNSALLPCVTYALISGNPESYLAAAPSIEHLRVQVDCWALTLSQADALHHLVRRALVAGGRNAESNSNGHDYEAETKRYRVSADYEFWVDW